MKKLLILMIIVLLELMVVIGLFIAVDHVNTLKTQKENQHVGISNGIKDADSLKQSDKSSVAVNTEQPKADTAEKASPSSAALESRERRSCTSCGRPS